MDRRFAFIGFGEAGQALSRGWRGEADFPIQAFDIKTDDAALIDAKLADYAALAVTPKMTAIDAAADADVIVSAVTADAVLDAADSVVPGLKPGVLYLDINSAAPERKREAARRVGAAGADYVDVAVMAPVNPKLHKTPLLIGGPGAARAEPLLRRLGMLFEVVSQRVGDASTIKMVRSVMIKGLESLTVECLCAAVKAGIDGRILESLATSFPEMNWPLRAGYMMERMVSHGARRAAEMREVAQTMDDLGIGGTMAAATAVRQQWIADMDLGADFPDGPPRDYHVLAEAILAKLNR